MHLSHGACFGSAWFVVVVVEILVFAGNTSVDPFRSRSTMYRIGVVKREAEQNMRL